MQQLSMFESIPFPLCHDDVLAMIREHVLEGEKDDDVFTSSPVKNGYSYFFYGVKAFEFRPGSIETARLIVPVTQADGKKKFVMKKASDFPGNDLSSVLEMFKEMKRNIFRSILVDEFGCCNDFVACSDALHCLHQDDRFYNGCLYRGNLESGKVFYGKNKNV